jgi:O-succinylbenzoic acid--CoA ligase
MVVEGWLERAAAKAPSRTAIETSQGRCSYAELLALARAGSAELAARGVERGAHVAIALPAGLAFAQALHACMLLGAVAVPVDLRLSTTERETLTANTTTVVDEPLTQLPIPGVVAHTRAAAHSDPSGVEALSSMCGHALDAPVIVIYTSGTTSAPRPVQLTYGNFLWSALGSAVALGCSQTDTGQDERWLCALPLSHVGGLSILMRSAIYATTAVVHERFETERVLQALSEQQITLISLVGTTLARLLDAGLQHPPVLRCALTGGGPVSPALLDRARAAGVPVSQTYGLTESCSQATTTPLAAIGEDPGAAGTPLFCTRVRIAPDGEIMLSGPTVAPASRDRDGWLRTGDLGSLDEQGRLHVTGRKSDTIVSGGENVAPAEVEAVLEAHPGVLEAAVLGRADPRWGEAVTAIVVARADMQIEGEALRAHCAVSLAPYKVPKQIELREQALPRTRSGKLLRRELA